ncbi:MAG: CorA family divalent cation transporter, partial [Acidimicrobiia bacterium]
MGTPGTRVWRAGAMIEEGFPLAKVSDFLEDAETLVWVDLCKPDKEQLDELAAELQLHELAVEDALSEHQRPKVDYYDTHLFLACHAVQVSTDGGDLHATEIDAFVGPRWLITVRKDEGFDIAPVLARWDRSLDLVKCGSGFLLYGLLDIVVDGYFDAMQVFDDYYDDVSEGLFADVPLDPNHQRQWFE